MNENKFCCANFPFIFLNSIIIVVIYVSECLKSLIFCVSLPSPINFAGGSKYLEIGQTHFACVLYMYIYEQLQMHDIEQTNERSWTCAVRENAVFGPFL